ncbi:MAG: DUF502 domain-containing protein [Flavobacteriales bacterium]|nr:DUF502 domain-containing protein [Flavobacteriales bacterium]MCB9166924.1 DUF502 domain-containing protein [Flavobacteriales bacterium]
MDPRRLIGHIVSLFLRGLLLVMPVTIIVYGIYQLFIWLDRIIPFDVPGLGLLSLLVIITLAGWLGSTILFRPLAELGEEVLQRIPILKTIYEALKDLVGALVGNKRSFDRPVLVRMVANSNLEKLGFITQDDLSVLGIPGNKVAVYLPHSFAWSGNVYIVPSENVTPINAKAGDVMKFIVSGGVAHVEDETE